MTVLVSNVQLTNTFDYWRGQTNLLANAMSNSCVTVQSNAAVGNAVITGTFQSLTVYANSIGGVGVVNSNGTVNTTTANLTFSTNTVLAAGASLFGSTTSTLNFGNSTVNAVVNSSTITLPTGNITNLISGTVNATTLNVTTINGTGVITTTANVVSNNTVVALAVRIANTTQNVTIIPPSAAQANSTNYLNALGTWSTVAAPATVSAGGSNTNIQFNDSTSFGGTAGFTFDKTTNNVTVANTLSSALLTVATSGLTYVANGNIGIGTATPSADVDIVRNTNNGEQLRINNSNTGTSASAAVQLISATSNAVFSVNGTVGTIGTTTAHPFNIFANNASRLFVAANGNIGVQTSTPGFTLDVNGILNVATSISVPTVSLTTLNANTVNANNFGGSGIASVGQYWANTAGKVVTVDTAWNSVAIQGLVSSATVTPDLGVGINFGLTATSNFTLANPSNLKAGQSGLILIAQDATGSRTISYGSSWKFPSGAAKTLSTGAGSIDFLFYTVYNTTFIVCSLNRAFS